MSWVPTDYYFQQELLGESEDSPSSPFIGCLAGVYLALFIGPLPGLSRKTLLTQFTEAAFGSYARQLINWRLPYFSQLGYWTLEGACLHWQSTNTDPAQVLLGAGIVTAPSGGQLMMALAFPGVGIPMTNPQDAYTAIPRFAKDPLAYWGDLVQAD